MGQEYSGIKPVRVLFISPAFKVASLRFTSDSFERLVLQLSWLKRGIGQMERMAGISLPLVQTP